MNTQIIYEATNNITLFSLPFIIIALAFILVIIYIIKTWKNSKEIVGKILFLLIPIGMSVVLIAQLVTFFQTKHVFSKYENGNCEVAEGQIVNYETHYKVGTMSEEDYPDRFFVDDTEFIVYGYQTYGIEYYLRQADGSKLKEGQTVKIQYINFKHENLILKIEIK